MRVRVLNAALLGMLCIPNATAAQFWDDGPELSERQIETALQRSERMLREGKPLPALRSSRSPDAALLSEHTFRFPKWQELCDRARSIGWIAVVRLRGSHDIAAERAKDPRVELLKAEERLRDLLPRKNPLYTARHAEALVALGDRMPEAYAALLSLHETAALTEPESYAALLLAARATGHADIALAAQQRCRKLAKRRAQRVCPK
jgi:hypothetical protein